MSKRDLRLEAMNRSFQNRVKMDASLYEEHGHYYILSDEKETMRSRKDLIYNKDHAVALIKVLNEYLVIQNKGND